MRYGLLRLKWHNQFYCVCEKTIYDRFFAFVRFVYIVLLSYILDLNVVVVVVIFLYFAFYDLTLTPVFFNRVQQNN